jgi:hypothetical protein
MTDDNIKLEFDTDPATGTLQEELERLSGQRHYEIRKHFYAIADHLKPLMEQLELADTDNGGFAGPLLDEHLMVAACVDLFEKLKIGNHL